MSENVPAGWKQLHHFHPELLHSEKLVEPPEIQDEMYISLYFQNQEEV